MAVDEFVEFQKQYEKTFIRIKFEGSSVFQVINVRSCIADDFRNPYLVIQNPHIGQCTVMWNETSQQFNYDFPKVGLFNHGSCFLMFHRFPDRQWKRGLYATNAHLSNPLRDIYGHIPKGRELVNNMFKIGYETLTSAFAEDFPDSIDQAIVTLGDRNMMGVALNPMFGITKSPTTVTKLVLWKHLSMIGLINTEKKEIEIIETTFAQEFLDLLKRKQEAVWQLK